MSLCKLMSRFRAESLVVVVQFFDNFWQEKIEMVKLSSFEEELKFHLDVIIDLNRMLLSSDQSALKKYKIQLSILSNIDQILDYCSVKTWNADQFTYLTEMKRNITEHVKGYQSLPTHSSAQLQQESISTRQVIE